ncbi:MAG: sugar phosphate isomerase/epimerase [Clostridiales bacterium]|nr:sugar phosphate isomerase/epimerase [Clostridiales bacterium]
MNETRIGLSSACFYPRETFESIKKCTDLGFRNIEIFMNSFSELEEPYLRRIAEHCRDTGTIITSIHPFTSGYEYMLFFSAYKKRAAESAEFYKKYFHAAAYLGAKFTVFHGDATRAPFFGMDNYCEVLDMLMETARREGTILAHENVSSARGGDPEFMRELHERFGVGNISFVFDVKQTVRGGYDPHDMLDAMGGDIVHVHINDWKDGECRLPYAGTLELDNIISHIESNGYSGKYVIEVYNHNFNDISEIAAAKLALIANCK